MDYINPECIDITDENYLHSILNNDSCNFDTVQGPSVHTSKNSMTELQQNTANNYELKGYLLSSNDEFNDFQISNRSVHEDTHECKNSYEDDVYSMNSTNKSVISKDINNLPYAVNETEKSTLLNIEELQNVENYGSIGNLMNGAHQDMYNMERDKNDFNRNKEISNSYHTVLSSDYMKKSECGFMNSMLRSPNRSLNISKTVSSNLDYLNLFDLNFPKVCDSSGFKYTFSNPGLEIYKAESKVDHSCLEKYVNVVDFNSSCHSHTSSDSFTKFPSGDDENYEVHTYDEPKKCDIFLNTDRENSINDISLNQKDHSLSSYSNNIFPQKLSLPEYVDISVSATCTNPHKILNENKCENYIKELQKIKNKQDDKMFFNNSDTTLDLSLKNDVNYIFTNKISCTNALSENEIDPHFYKSMANENRNEIKEYGVKVDERIAFVSESFAEFNSSLLNNNDKNYCSFENMHLNTKKIKFDDKYTFDSLDNVLVRNNEKSVDVLCQQEGKFISDLNTKHNSAATNNLKHQCMLGNNPYNANTLSGPDYVTFALEENKTPHVDCEMSSCINLRSPMISSVSMSELYYSPLRYNFSPARSHTKNSVVWSTQSPIPSYSSLFSPFYETNSLLEDCLKTPDINNSAVPFDKNENRNMDSIEILLDEYLSCFNEKSTHEMSGNTNRFEKISIERISKSSEDLLTNYVNDDVFESNIFENDNLDNLLNNKSRENLMERSSQNISTCIEPLINSELTTVDSVEMSEALENNNRDIHIKNSCKLSNTATSDVKIYKPLNESGFELDFVIQNLLLENSKDTENNSVGDINTNHCSNNDTLICGKNTRSEESVLEDGMNELEKIPFNKTSSFRLIYPKQPVYVKPNFFNKFTKCDRSFNKQRSHSKKQSISTYSSIRQLKKQTRNQFKRRHSHLKEFPVSTFIKTLKDDSPAQQDNIQRLSKENMSSSQVEKIVISTGSFDLRKQNNHECCQVRPHKILFSSEGKTKCHIRLADKPIKCVIEGKKVENIESCKLRALKFINGSDRRFHIQDGSGSWPEREEFDPQSFGYPVKNTVTNIENTILNPPPNPKLPLPRLSSIISRYAPKNVLKQQTGGCVGISTTTQTMSKGVVYPVGKTGISITIPTGIVPQHNIMPCEASISTSVPSKKLNVGTPKILDSGQTSKFFCKLKKTGVSNKSKKILQQSKPMPNKQYSESVNHRLILPNFKAFTQPLQIQPSLNPQTTVNVPFTVCNMSLQSNNILEVENSKKLVIQDSSLKPPISICQVSLSQSIPANSMCLMVPTNSGCNTPNYVLDRNAKYNLGNITDNSTILGKNKSTQDMPIKILPNTGILGNLAPICSVFQKVALNRTEWNHTSSLRPFDYQEENKQVPNTIKINTNDKTKNQLNQFKLVQKNSNNVEVDLASTSNIIQHLRRNIFKRKPYPDSIKHKVRNVLKDDIRHRFPGISEEILEQLSIPPQVSHRGYFSVRDVKIIQNQILSLQLNSIYKEHVIVCSIQNCHFCLKYEKQKKTLMLAEREQRFGKRLLNNSRKQNLSKGRGKGRGRNRKGNEDISGSTDKDPTYKSPIGSEKRKMSEHQYMEYLDKKNKLTEHPSHNENEPNELLHTPNCALHLVKKSIKRSNSESNVSDANIKMTCFGSCDDSCIKLKFCRICRSCSKDSTYTEKYNDSAKSTSLINFIKNLLKKKGSSCVTKMEKNMEKNELCISKYKKNLQLKDKIEKEFPPFSEHDSETSQNGVPRNLPRPLYLELHSLQVGSNILAADYQQQLIPKLRIIYSARKFVYELKLHDGGIDHQNNQGLPLLLVIDVPFKTVKALSIFANKVLVCVDTVPWVGVLGRRRACRVVMPNPVMTESQQKLVTLIKAALTIHPVHKLILPDHGRALAMYNGLTGVFPWFRRVLKMPFPITETDNPTWSLKAQLDIDHIMGQQLNQEGFSLQSKLGT